MCRAHLLAEHRETHIMAGAIVGNVSTEALRGMTDKMVLNPHTVMDRHDDLVAEMTRRGYGHTTPMIDLTVAIEARGLKEGFVCPVISSFELHRRCVDCRKLQRASPWVPSHPGGGCNDACVDRAVRDFTARPSDPKTGLAIKPAS